MHSHLLPAYVGIGLFILTGTAAGADAIDGSSPAAFEQSIAMMTADLTPAERKTFSAGLVKLSLERYPPAVGSAPEAAWIFAPAAIEAAPRTLDGIGLSEILAIGTEHRESEAAIEAEQAAERADFEAKRAEQVARRERLLQEAAAARQQLDDALAAAQAAAPD